MRVVHVTQSLAGGPATYLNDLAPTQLTELGSENVFFIVPEEQRHHLKVPDLNVRTFRRSGRTPLELLQSSWEMGRILRELAPDIIHLHSTFAGAMVRLQPQFWGAAPRKIYCAHGWSFLMETHPLKQTFYAALERVLSKFTDVIINISNFEELAALARGLPANKLVTVLNGREDVVPPDRNDAEADPARINLLFIGRFDRQKGLDILLDRMSTIDESMYILHVVGSNVVDDQVMDTTVYSNVCFHGWLDEPEIADLLVEADVVVMPSRWEGFGLVAVEAMRAGRPVLASDRGALPEVVRDGVVGRIFNLEDREDFARVLRGETKESWAEKGRAARVEFERRFTAERMNRSILQIYNQIFANVQGDSGMSPSTS